MKATTNTPQEICPAHQIDQIFSDCDTLLDHHSTLLLALEKSCDGSRTLTLSPADESAALERRKTNSDSFLIAAKHQGIQKLTPKDKSKSDGVAEYGDSSKRQQLLSELEKRSVVGSGSAEEISSIQEHEEQEEDEEEGRSFRRVRSSTENQETAVVADGGGTHAETTTTSKKEGEDITISITPYSPTTSTSEGVVVGVVHVAEALDQTQHIPLSDSTTSTPTSSTTSTPTIPRKVSGVTPLPPVPSIATAFVSMVEGMRGPYTK